MLRENAIYARTNEEIEISCKSYLSKYCILNKDVWHRKASVDIQNGGIHKRSF